MTDIIVDADDTILNYSEKLFKYANITPPKDVVYEDICNFLTTEHGYSYEDVQSLIVDFNHSPSFKAIEPLRGSDKVLKKLKDDGVNLHVITSCGDSSRTKSNRILNLKETFGDIFSNIHILPLMSRKINTLLPYINEDVVFVEDTLQHYNDANLLGIPSYILKGNLNKPAHQDDINTFDSWNDFYNIYWEKHK